MAGHFGGRGPLGWHREPPDESRFVDSGAHRPSARLSSPVKPAPAEAASAAAGAASDAPSATASTSANASVTAGVITTGDTYWADTTLLTRFELRKIP